MVALCSRRRERVAAAAEQLGIAETSTDWREFVRRDDLDLVSVCTPVDLHAEQTIAAVEAGKHVLCEKPVALDAAEAARMPRRPGSGRRARVCFGNRFDPVRSRSATPSPAACSAPRTSPDRIRASTTGTHARPPVGVEYASAKAADTHGMSTQTSTSCASSLASPRRSAPTCAARSRCATRPDGTMFAVDADDTSVVVLRMQSGTVATISCSAVAFGASARELELAGSEGRIVVEGGVQEGGNAVRVHRVGDDARRDPGAERT